MELCLSIRQVCNLGDFTSFPLLVSHFVNEPLTSLHQPQHTAGFKEQEYDNQGTVYQCVQIPAVQATTVGAGWQQRKISMTCGSPKTKAAPRIDPHTLAIP